MSFQHPKGLYMLFATEMWERFSFYTMQALLVLYATAALADGGLGLGTADAIALYGYYGAAVYIMPMIGAYCADRFIGMQRAVLLGGALMAAGHFMMVFNQYSTFIVALVLLSIGNGFFKPCITSLLGCLYDDKPEGKDSAYNIFYMGINIGALMAGLVGGWLQMKYGFHYAFAMAGIGMICGQATFMWGRKRFLGDVGMEPHVTATEDQVEQPLTREEKGKVWALVVVCFFILFFFIGYWQYGGALTLYAEDFTNRQIGGYEIPTAWFFSLNPLFIIICCPVVSMMWSRVARYTDTGLDIRKVLVGFALTALSFLLLWWGTQGVNPESGIKSGMWLLVLYYLLITIGEYCIVPVSLALVSKIAPRRYLSRLMSSVLLSIGLAGICAGYLGGLIESMEPSEVFYMIFMLLSVITVLLLFCFPWIERQCGLRSAEREKTRSVPSLQPEGA